MKALLEKTFYNKPKTLKDIDEKSEHRFDWRPNTSSFDKWARQERKTLTKRNKARPDILEMLVNKIEEKRPYFYHKPFKYEEIPAFQETLPMKGTDMPMFDPRLRNKTYAVDDYRIHVHYTNKVDPFQKLDQVTDFWMKKPTSESLYGGHNVTHTVNVTLEHRGVFMCIGRAFLSCTISMYYGNNHYFRNRMYTRIPKYEEGRRVELKEYHQWFMVDDRSPYLDAILTAIPHDEPLSNSTITTQKYFRNDYHKQLWTLHDPDFEFFLNKDITNGVFKPSRTLLDRVLRPSDYSGKYKQPSKELLHDLGVTTVRLRAKEHFPVASMFSMKGIQLAAPESVVKKYGYERYVADEKMLDKIQKDKADAKRQEELEKYNDTFSLVFHGKTILEDVSSYKIRKYLENKSQKDTEKGLVDDYKHIFKIFPEMQKYEIVSFGTYHYNELAGERHYDDDKYNEHLSDETRTQIEELYSHALSCPSKRWLELKYDWPERGGKLLGVRRRGKSIELYLEDYELH